MKRHQLFGILVIFIGIIFLLSQFGLMGSDIWSGVASFWPILLIALGLSFFKKTANHTNWIPSALLLMFALGIITKATPLASIVKNLATEIPFITNNVDTRTSSINIPSNSSVLSANLNFNLDNAKVNLSTGADDIVSGSTNAPKSLVSTWNQSGVIENIFFNEQNEPIMGQTNNIDLKLSSKIPFDINNKGNYSDFNFNGKDINLSRVTIDSKQLKLTMNFGIPKGHIPINITSKSSEITFKIDNNINFQLTAPDPKNSVNIMKNQANKVKDHIWQSSDYSISNNVYDIDVEGKTSINISQ